MADALSLASIVIFNVLAATGHLYLKIKGLNMDDSTRIFLFLAIGIITFLLFVLFIGRTSDSPEDIERKRLANERERLEIEKLRVELEHSPAPPEPTS